MNAKQVAVLLIPLFLCSCSNEAYESVHTSRVVDSYASISIETINTDLSGEETFESENFDVHESEYEIAECEFNVDTLNHTITAHYDDTEVNSDGFVIDIDLHYYDYGVSEVAIYEATASTRPSQYRINLNDTEWQESLDGSSPIDTYSTNINRQELSINSALSFSNYSIEDNSDIENLVSLLVDKYDIFPFYAEYIYPIAEMNLYDREGNEYEDGEIHMITLRTNLNGIPVGILRDNERIQSRLRFGDYYGSFFGVFDDYTCGYSLDSASVLVDFRNYNYEPQIVPESEAIVLPLEACISNAMPGIFNEANFVGGHYCQVYAAELVYVPFSVGCTGLGDFAFDVYYVPVWALYTVAVGNSVCASAVYLNATTGELVSNGI